MLQTQAKIVNIWKLQLRLNDFFNVISFKWQHASSTQCDVQTSKRCLMIAFF